MSKEIKQDEFLNMADDEQWTEFTLSFDNRSIQVTFEDENLNRFVRDFFRFQKPKFGIVPFEVFCQDVNYFVSRGCKISEIKVNYQGSLWHRIQILARGYRLQKLKG